MASMVTLAIMSLSPPSGLNQPMRRQNSRDSPARVGCCSAWNIDPLGGVIGVQN